MAPAAYPRSLQSRYTPTAEARQLGCATSPIAASSVGYPIAVPTPSRTPVYPVAPSYYPNSPGRAGLLMGYASLNERDIRAGVKRLAEVV